MSNFILGLKLDDMNIKLPLLAIALYAGFTASGQTKIKDGTLTSGSLPNASAVLDLESNSKGLLLPRLTTTQRNGMTSVPEGMIIFNTTDSCVNQFNRGNWNSLCETDDYCGIALVGDNADSTFDYIDPNTAGGIFEPAGTENSCALYITEDGRTWRWNGTSYVLRNDVYVEPWWNRLTNKPSRSFTDHLYHLGSANVGTGFANGVYSMAVGSRDTVSGAYSLAVGANNIIRQSASYSVASGYNNRVVGSQSAVFGSNIVDSARYSIVTGSNNIVGAAHSYSAVFGRLNLLSGTGSPNFILGIQDTITNGSLNFITGDKTSIAQSSRNFASGFGHNITGGSGMNIAVGQSHILFGGGYSAVFGNTNKDSSSNNFIGGSNNTIRTGSNNSVILGGTSNTINGLQSFAFGSSNTIGSQYAYTFGRNNTVNHQNAMVLGESASSSANNQLVLGFSNGVVLPKSGTAPASPVEGQLYFNTANKKTYVYDGTTWQSLY